MPMFVSSSTHVILTTPATMTRCAYPRLNHVATPASISILTTTARQTRVRMAPPVMTDVATTPAAALMAGKESTARQMSMNVTRCMVVHTDDASIWLARIDVIATPTESARVTMATAVSTTSTNVSTTVASTASASMA